MEVVASILASSLSLSFPPGTFPHIAMSIHLREKGFFALWDYVGILD